jgi:hypothetical protein
MSKYLDTEQVRNALIRATRDRDGYSDGGVFASYAPAGMRALERMTPGGDPTLAVAQEMVRDTDREVTRP